MSLAVSVVLQKIFQDALEEAIGRNHEFITPEHLLFASIANPKVLKLFKLSGSDLEYIHDSLDEYLKTKVPAFPKVEDKQGSPMPSHSSGMNRVFERAGHHCTLAEKNFLGVTDILVSLFDEDQNHCSFFMKKSGIDRLNLLQVISHPEFYDNGSSDSKYLAASTDEDPIFDILSSIDKDNQAHEKPANTSRQQDRDQANINKKNKKILQKYTVNLTKLATQGELNPVIGREEEIERTIQVLCKKQKNNPLHVGESGVGKTAITEGLAQRIVAGNVPSFLKNSTIYAIKMPDLLAGAKFRGDFEERVKRIIAEIQSEKKSILFIDEIHTIMEANSGSGGGGLEATDILKPLLANGKLRCIGATTYDEYTKYFSKDKALARRFQKIDIEEPTEDQALNILKGLRKGYEDFHKVHYSDEVLKQAVHLSALHIRERFLPDKAIDLIDETGSLLKIKRDKLNNSEVSNNEIAIDQESTEFTSISLKDVDRVIAKMARIPEKHISTNETEKLRHFDELLSKKVFGQAEAIKNVTKAVKRSRAGFRGKDKPVANFLFVGPTGVGKTELAKVLANELGIALHRFDMSEYQEKHTVSRLIGSPPGYVGYEEGGLLTDAIRKQPNAVLLLDEIEKAHSDIYNILLQIMDYASLTDNQGRKASFSNVILIMTSNAGSGQLGKPIIGFGDEVVSESAIDEAIEKSFSPEFRNRLDAVIKFSGLSLPVMSLIVKKEVEKVKSFLTEKNLDLDISDGVINLLAEKGFSPEFGARNAARLVEDEFVTPLTDIILFENPKKGSSIKCKIRNKKKRPYLIFS